MSLSNNNGHKRLIVFDLNGSGIQTIQWAFQHSFNYDISHFKLWLSLNRSNEMHLALINKPIWTRRFRWIFFLEMANIRFKIVDVLILFVWGTELPISEKLQATILTHCGVKRLYWGKRKKKKNWTEFGCTCTCSDTHTFSCMFILTKKNYDFTQH